MSFILSLVRLVRQFVEPLFGKPSTAICANFMNSCILIRYSNSKNYVTMVGRAPPNQNSGEHDIVGYSNENEGIPLYTTSKLKPLLLWKIMLTMKKT